MSDDVIRDALISLQNSAQRLKDAVHKANQLPDNFPTSYFDDLLDHLKEIDAADVDSIRLAEHLKDKLLLTAHIYQDDDDDRAFLRILHNDLFLEVSQFLQVTNASAQFRDHGKNRLALEGEEDRQRLLVQAIAALRDAKRAESEVQNYIQQNGVINIGQINVGDIKLTIEIALIKARRALTSIVIELKSDLIDVDWIAEFTRFVSSCAEEVGRAVQRLGDSIRNSSMVQAILSFIQTTVEMAQGFRSFMQEAAIERRPRHNDVASSDTFDAGTMGVRVGQKYRQKNARLIWVVEAVVRESDLMRNRTLRSPYFAPLSASATTDATVQRNVAENHPTSAKRKFGDHWHARMVAEPANVFRTKSIGVQTKTIGVAILVDSRDYELVE